MNKHYVAAALALLALGGYPAAKAQPTSSRLVAMTNYTGNLTQLLQSDSILYKYPSGYTNSVSETNSFKWLGGKVSPDVNEYNTYDSKGFLVGREWQLYMHSTKTFEKHGRTWQVNDAAGRLLHELTVNWNKSAAAYTDSSRQVVFVRDAAGNPVSELVRYFDSPTKKWRDAIRTTRTFNAQGSVLTEGYESYSVSGWNVGMAHHYSYDASGKNMLSDTTLTADPATPGARMRIGVQTYLLNSSGKPVGTTSWSWNATNNVYDSNSRSTFAYNAAGRLARTTNYVKYTGQPFRNYYQDDYSYNNYNQVTKLTRFYWGTSAFDYLSIYRLYYYGSYIPASVPGVSSGTPALTISPNPAVDGMRVQVQGTGEFTALLMDMQGRVHQRFGGNATGGFEQLISVSSMPAGTYVLKISGTSGVSSQLFTVRH